FELGGRGLEAREERLVLREFGDPLGAEAVEERDRVVAALLPAVLVDTAEEVPRRVMPAPMEVRGEAVQRAQRRGQLLRDLERVRKLRMLHAGIPVKIVGIRTTKARA